jgi:hypothetical protein
MGDHCIINRFPGIDIEVSGSTINSAIIKLEERLTHTY